MSESTGTFVSSSSSSSRFVDANKKRCKKVSSILKQNNWLVIRTFFTQRLHEIVLCCRNTDETQKPSWDAALDSAAGKVMIFTLGWLWLNLNRLGTRTDSRAVCGNIYIYSWVQTLALAEMAHRDGAAFSFSLWITNTFLFSRASYLSGDWLWWSCRWRLSLCFIELVHHLFSETLDFFFLSLRVYYSFRLICILIWELFAFLLLDTEQIVTQEAYESRLTPITLPPNKNNHFPSNYETEQLAVCARSALEEDNIITFIGLIMQQQAVLH